MASNRFGSVFEIEWVNITYRSLALAVLVLGLAGVGGWYWHSRASVGPRNEAAEAIAGAAAALARAEDLPNDSRVEEIRSTARVALGEARQAFDGGDYDRARIAAIRAENLSQQALDLSSGSAARNVVRFYRLEGDVRVKRAGEFAWEPASSRMVLNVGDQVKTSSSGSAQLIYFDQTMTTVEPGSLLEIRDLHEDPVTRVRRVREKLNWGELLASTQKRNVDGSFHEVVTEKATARSEAEGEFRVAYDKENGTGAFDVFRGQILVSTPSSRQSVGAGERVRSTHAGRLTAKELLSGVPRLISPSDQRVFVHDDPSKIRIELSWESVPDTAGYRLQIARGPLFTALLHDQTRGQTSARIEGVPGPGDYHWRVASVPRSGGKGPFSQSRRFRVSAQRIRDRQDHVPPALEITGFVSVGPMLIINGATEPGASLWIGSERVDISEDGSFYAVLRLTKEGDNEVRLVAQDNAGNEAVVTRSAYVEAY
jgi:hypothetical protein